MTIITKTLATAAGILAAVPVFSAAGIAEARPAPTTISNITTTTPSPASRILSAAQSHVGEGPQKVLTPEEIAADKAWCSEFASMVVTEAGAANLFTLGTPGTAVNTGTNRWYNWATANSKMVWSDSVLRADGTAANTLNPNGVKPGDVVLMWHWSSSRNIWSSHTAIVENVTISAKTGKPVINTIDGNWNDMVVRRTLDKDTKGKIFAVIRFQ